MSFVGHCIKQQDIIEQLVSQLDPKLCGEDMTSKDLKKINAKVNFLHSQNKPNLCVRGLLCDALIQSYL